jgi:C-terminal processing protease CtpA/Prc
MAVAEMVSHTKDTHCFVNSQTLETALGAVPAPIVVRWVENKAVVTRVAAPATSGRVEVGDVITKVDGLLVQSRIDLIRKHTAHSTEQSAMARAANTLTAGEDGTSVRLSLIGSDGVEREAEMKRAYVPGMYGREGEVFRLFDAKTGYVDLTRLEPGQVDEMFDKFRNTATIIMDMRGYPRGTAWSIAPRLATKQEMVAAQFRRNLIRGTPGEDSNSSLYFEQRIPQTDKPRYGGKTVMLIDENAVSQSEHSGLFYKTANGTTFIGSPTTGANGDVTFFIAPGNIRVNFSGHDVRWPDGRQLQRVGLQPDIYVRPTIEGIRAGKDEVLDRAIEFARTGK